MTNYDTPSLHQLQKLYQSGQLLPFIGAGISMSLTWNIGDITYQGPSWSDLADVAAKTIGFDDAHLLRARGDDLQILEYCIERLDGERAKVYNALRDLLKAPNNTLKDSQVHAALASMKKCDVMYTTNFDNFLERAIALHGRPCMAVATEANLSKYFAACDDSNTRPCKVVKFHGDFDNPAQMVLTESDYRQRLSLSKPLDALLRADLIGRVALFLGYSFRDWNISYLFHLVDKDFGAEPTSGNADCRAFITVPDPSEFEMLLFKSRKIKVIPVNGKTADKDIAALLNSISQSHE